jgi:chromosome segregation ATPase
MIESVADNLDAGRVLAASKKVIDDRLADVPFRILRQYIGHLERRVQELEAQCEDYMKQIVGLNESFLELAMRFQELEAKVDNNHDDSDDWKS